MEKKRNVINFILPIILVLFIMFFINKGVFATTGIITDTTVKIRSNSTTDSSILTLVSINEKVEILEKNGEWYKVKYNNYTGYIRNDLIKVDGEVQNTNTNTQTTNTNQTIENKTSEDETTSSTDIQINIGDKKKVSQIISIRRVPTIISKEFDKIEANTEIEIVEIKNSWVKVKSSDKNGWVRITKLKEAVKEVENVSQEQVIQREAQETSLNQTTKVGYVNTDTLNLREATDKTSKVLKNLTKNQEVEILETIDGWYKVKVNNITGYVAEKYISSTKIEVTSRSLDEDRATVSTESVNVESESKEAQQNVSTSGMEVVTLAQKYIGYKYVSGGSTPEKGFDCSGFTSYIYSKFGVSLSRTAAGQRNQGTEIDINNIKVGDLLIFNNSLNSSVGHVGIYIGNNQFIHASNPSAYPVGGVKITSLSDSYYKQRFVCAKRVL